MFYTIKVILFAAGILLPVVSYSEVLTFKSAYEYALTSDSILKGAEAENNAQQFETRKAFSAFLPQARLSLFKGRGRTDSETQAVNGGTMERTTSYESENFNFTIRQSLYNKTNLANYDKANASAKIGDNKLELAKSEIISRLASSYFDILLLTENITYNNKLMHSVETQLMQAQRKYDAGQGTVIEIHEARAKLDDIQAVKIELNNELELAKQSLQIITNVYPDKVYALNVYDLKLAEPLPNNVNEWIAKAFENNPEIKSASNEVDFILAEIEKSRAGHYPTLDLVLSKSQTANDNNFTIGSKYKTESIGLQLDIPIYAGGLVQASIGQSLARLDLAKENLKIKKNEIELNVRKYFNGITNGILKISAYDQAVSSNKISAQGTSKGYLAGTRTNVEVINSQERLYFAMQELAKQRYKFLYNQVMLKQSAGILDAGSVNEFDRLFTVSTSLDSQVLN